MSISRNAAYNAVGATLPSVLTLVTVPLYLSVVGVERYGILALCWVILGYSSFLDLGLGPAVAQRIAAARNRGDVDVARIFWTSFWISCVMGIVGAAAIYFGANLYFGSVAQVNSGFRSEMEQAIPLLAAIAPIQMIGSVLGGALQGRERFLAMNALGVLGNTLLSLLPLLLAYVWTPNLTALIAGAVAARLIPLPLTFWVCKRAVPLGAAKAPSRRIIKETLSFGGWMSVATLAIGILANVDRLAIGSAIGAAAVSAFTIPHSLVSRMVLIPHSLGPVLFPRFAYVDETERERLLSSSIQAVAVLVTPISIGLIAIADPFFTLWIGPELTSTSTPIAYVLAAGFWVYSVGYPAFSMLQATGRHHLVSKLLLAQLVPYVASIFIAMWAFGLIGAAIASTLRYLLDSSLMLRLAGVRLAAVRFLLLPAALVAVSVAVAAGMSGFPRYLAFAALLAASVVWSAFHTPEVLRPYVRKLTSLLPHARWRAR